MTDPKDIQITNFRRVNDWLYRGGQFDLDEGLMHLKQIGIKTIICLRWNIQAIEQERKKVEAANLNFVGIPLTYWVYPTSEEIDKFFRTIDDQSNRPVYVHCKHGSDRTGMLIAFYRMARENWNVDDAYNEMKNCGFHKIRMHHFKWAVYKFPRQYHRLKKD
ncbi:MAG: dual specificity protein phosphatase family protein [Cyanobacteria bacterium]|nr:dual specificity protein phosphatase family protein [Cyanobacteriota bacterium]